MADVWQEVPAMPAQGYGGMTRLTRNGRTLVCLGIGEEVRAIVEAAMVERENAPPAALGEDG